MSHTRGGASKRKCFTWHCDLQLDRITTTSEDGTAHTYHIAEIQSIVQYLHSKFGDAFFPLANNVAKLGAGTEQRGLGTAILAQKPGDTTHAQGASYLGVVLEEAGYFEWNGRHRGIAWRLIDHDFSAETLVARLQAAAGIAPDQPGSEVSATPGPASQISQRERDRMVCQLASTYLLGLPSVTPERLARHLSCPPSGTRPDSLPGLYKRLLGSALNANMLPGVILQAIGSIERLADPLLGFQPVAVRQRYGDHWEPVLDEIVAKLHPAGEIRRESKSLWPRFCRTITSGARFLADSQSASDFYAWIDVFDRDDRTRPALPMVLSHEIVGFGFPLACDFVKELGYPGFGKPDIHLKTIFTALELCSDTDNYRVFKAIVRVASNAGATPYEIDKLFWLIGSGSLQPDGPNIGRHRGQFIDYASRRLSIGEPPRPPAFAA